MSSTRSGPPRRPARPRAKPTPNRLATLAPTSSTAAEPRVSSSRGASCVGAVGPDDDRPDAQEEGERGGVPAGDHGHPRGYEPDEHHHHEQPDGAHDDGSPHCQGVPAQPSVLPRRWRGGGHRGSVADRIAPCHHSWSSPIALWIELLAACSVPFEPVGDRAVFMAWMALVSSRIWLDRLSSSSFCCSSC